MTNGGWLIKTKDGTLTPVHNLATARYLVSILEATAVVDSNSGMEVSFVKEGGA
jgi:hypothetical protein